MKKLQALIIGIFTILIFGAATANAVTWTVTKSTNGNDNVCDADCSLREAVFNADSGDTVNFSSSLVGQTITLGGSEIVITKRITIDGHLNDPNVAFISGSNTSRIFYIQPGGGLDLRNMTLVQGSGESSPGNPGNNVSVASGGAIIAFSGSALSLDRVAVRGNTAKFGGGIHLGNGTHHITNSSLTTNSAESGTAINQVNGGSLLMSNTTVSGNYLSADNQQTVGCGAICTRSVELFPLG